MIVDQSGVFWISSCGMVEAISAEEKRRYEWFDSPIPERLQVIAVDAENRIWFWHMAVRS